MNDTIFILSRIVVTVIAALVSAYVIPYIKKIMAMQQYAEVVEMIEIAVRAAEQTVKGSGMGKVKKAEVLNYASKWLHEKGIEITGEQLEQLIEAAVYEMNNEGEVIW